MRKSYGIRRENPRNTLDSSQILLRLTYSISKEKNEGNLLRYAIMCIIICTAKETTVISVQFISIIRLSFVLFSLFLNYVSLFCLEKYFLISQKSSYSSSFHNKKRYSIVPLLRRKFFL